MRYGIILATVLSLVISAVLPAQSAQETSQQSAKDTIEYGACLDLARYRPSDAVAAVTSLPPAEQHPAALHCLGIAHSNLGQYDQAANLFDRLAGMMVTEDHRNKAALLGQAGVAYRLAKKPAEALTRLDQATKLDPASADLWLDLAEVHLDLKDMPQALIAMDKALYFAPGNVTALVMRATTRRETGDTAGSEADVLKALQINPRDPEALIERSVQLKGINRLQTAVLFLRRAKDYAQTDDQRLRAQHYLKEFLPILKEQQDQAQ